MQRLIKTLILPQILILNKYTRINFGEIIQSKNEGHPQIFPLRGVSYPVPSRESCSKLFCSPLSVKNQNFLPFPAGIMKSSVAHGKLQTSVILTFLASAKIIVLKRYF